MSTRDWKLGEVVYLKSGSPAMTVVGTDSHGATKVQWYDPQAVEAERSLFPTATFPKDCLTEAEVPVRDAYQRPGATELPRISVESFRIRPARLGEYQPMTEEQLAQFVMTTLSDLFSRLSRTSEVATSKFAAEQPQPSEKIVEATSRAAEQRSEQATAQTTTSRTEPARTEQRQSVLDPAQASARHSRKNS